MGNRAPLTFNTVKHSHREKRLKKQRIQRLLILSMAAILALLVVCGIVFAVCAIVAAVTEDDSPIGSIQYQETTKFSTDIEAGPLSIINASYGIEKLPTELATMTAPKIDGTPIYRCSGSMLIQPAAQAAFDAMMTEYFNIYGADETVSVTTVFRSLKDQEGKSMPAGHSDHHSGYLLALNIAASANPEHWIFKNCHKYGFVLRYPTDKRAQTGVAEDYTEAIRYVGVAHATYMKENNLCLEEYAQQLQASSVDKQVQINGADGKLYSAYYVPAVASQLTQIKIPANYVYEISGDNIAGFVVTVKLSEPVA